MKYRISTNNHTTTYDDTDQEAMFEYIKTLMHLGIAISIEYEYTWQEIANTQSN